MLELFEKHLTYDIEEIFGNKDGIIQLILTNSI